MIGPAGPVLQAHQPCRSPSSRAGRDSAALSADGLNADAVARPDSYRPPRAPFCSYPRTDQDPSASSPTSGGKRAYSRYPYARTWHANSGWLRDDYDLPQITPMIVTLNVHSSRVSDLEWPDHLVTTPPVPVEGYRDAFGNWCNRLHQRYRLAAAACSSGFRGLDRGVPRGDVARI